jgi:adenine phosphoribosyltransferase
MNWKGEISNYIAIMSLALLKKQLEMATVIKKGDYRYILNAITEQDPALDPAILDDCANKLLQKLNFKGATKILTAETMGVPIATIISLKTSIPLIIATRRKKGTQNEIAVEYVCGYENGILHINNITKDDRVLIIDDLVSTAGTIISMVGGVRDIGAKINDIGVIFDKVDYGGMKELNNLGFQTKALLEVKFQGETIVVTEI